jgi:hypothetical protein
MIKVEHVEVFNFEGAIRGLRNPMNSWDKSDSDSCILCDECYADSWCNHDVSKTGQFIIGPNDMGLMRRLFKSGTEHRTYARMIQVSMDITAPLYWWKEMDRYTVGKSQVSTSTMHKIHSKEFELDDFSHEHLLDESIELLKTNIDSLNQWRNKYIIASKIDDIVGADLLPSKKTLWWQMIQLLPSSYNQKRTICMSYEVVFKIIKERTGHKLDEWNEFVEGLKALPYIEKIMED